MLTFRTKITAADLENVRRISASTDNFDEDDVDITVSLADDALYRLQHPEDEDLAHDTQFLFVEKDGKTCAYACYGHITDSNSTYELYWLATHRNYRGQGIGKKLIAELIRRLKAEGASKLFLKTDGKEQYKGTRHFYDSCGFVLEATLKQYYDKYDDCCIYSMCLDEDDFYQEPLAAAE